MTKTLGREEQGSAAWRWLANPTPANKTLGLAGALTGYGQRAEIRSDHRFTYAADRSTVWRALPTTADFIRVYPEHAFSHALARLCAALNDPA